MCTTGHIPPETSSRYGVRRCPQYVKYTRPLAGCPGGGGVPSVLSQPIPATSPTTESRKGTHFPTLLSSELLICNHVTEGLSYKIEALRVMTSECESCGITYRQGQVFGCHSETNGPFPTAKIILTLIHLALRLVPTKAWRVRRPHCTHQERVWHLGGHSSTVADWSHCSVQLGHCWEENKGSKLRLTSHVEGQREERRERRGRQGGYPIVVSNAFLNTNRFPTGTIYIWLRDIILCL